MGHRNEPMNRLLTLIDHVVQLIHQSEESCAINQQMPIHGEQNNESTNRMQRYTGPINLAYIQCEINHASDDCR